MYKVAIYQQQRAQATYYNEHIGYMLGNETRWNIK